MMEEEEEDEEEEEEEEEEERWSIVDQKECWKDKDEYVEEDEV